jgi:transcriptional regulator GlxA family with amidase domain
MRIDLVTFAGMDELDILGPLEVLRSAQSAGGAFDSRLVARERAGTVRGAHGIAIAVDEVFSPGADIVVVPGGGWVTRSAAGAWGEVERGDWLAPLASAATDGAVMASVCTGALLLAHAGVIGTRRAATHHAARADLAATGAIVVHDRVVDDGDLLSCGGVTSGLDLALWMVERFASEELAEAIAANMEYVRERPTGS